jgi:hypothetical protein
MWKHRLTTVFGTLAALGLMLGKMGIAIGHIGNTDFVTFVTALALGGVGVTAADATLVNAQAKAVDNLIVNNNTQNPVPLTREGIPAVECPIFPVKEK